MSDMSPELARKLAVCFRQYKGNKGETEELTTKLASAEKEKTDLQHENNALKAVLNGVKSGDIDPDDTDDKLAEYQESGEVKVASLMNTGAVGIGKVGSVNADTAIEGGDPLTAYLLGADQ